jgi:hypothetical protein
MLGVGDRVEGEGGEGGDGARLTSDPDIAAVPFRRRPVAKDIRSPATLSSIRFSLMLRRRIRVAREGGIATDPVEKLPRGQDFGSTVRNGARRGATVAVFDDPHLAQPLACSDLTQQYRGVVTNVAAVPSSLI